MMKRQSHIHRRRAFTLIEAVVVVLVVALAVPPTIMWLDEAVTRRADAANLNRAGMLASAVLENVIADCASDGAGLGFAALATPATYLSGGAGSLYTRLTSVAAPYQAAGLTYSVSIGGLVSSTGSADADVTQNVFRLVTVNVSYLSAAGGTRTLSVSCMVTGA